MPEYDVTVTVTHEARIRARSERAAIEAAEALNGTWPLDITDLSIDAERVRAGSTTSAQDRADTFNRDHPHGTPVRYWPGARVGEGRPSTVRGTAWVMPSGDAVVCVQDCAGGIALTHVEVAGGSDRG